MRSRIWSRFELLINADCEGARQITQDDRVVVVGDDAAMAIVLWIMFAWLHADIAVHSTLLVFKSADADTGKTTLCGVLQRLTPRA